MTKSKMGALLDSELPPEELPTIDTESPPVAAIQEKTPVQRIPDHRGKKISLKEQLYTSLGISRKYIPPITRKRAAVYQLVNFKGTIDNRLEGRDQFVDPFPYELVPTYSFVDTDEPELTRREKTMTYYEGGTETVYVVDPVTKRNIPQAVPKIGSPGFGESGQKVVNIYNEYGRYAWWELHPRNGSNKWRDMGKTPIFERVDIKYDSPHVANIREDLKLSAENYILSLKPDKLMNLGASLTNPTINTDIDPQQLKLALRMRARQNPEEVLFTNPDNQGSIKIACIHALDLGILTFVPENEAYYIGDEEEALYRVPIGNNPFESIVAFFNTMEGEDAYAKVKKDLQFWF